ncbi:MAG: hypothetical protein ALECFALPRED_010901 [Alectoria fallacina]|uniref:Protein kinase domain-containing protein n=1 Tax=Alectoria fallacina TaxID=1903189 RepID=A0A8H3J9S3_9LECA|nr:MAG: hypothetical protein ALECFALPRED_010901 [Alectoria fallacina]
MPSHAHTAPLQWSNHTNQHNDALHAFHTWRRSSEAQLLGIGGPHFESTCPFVPRSNLEKYFERPRQLEHLLDASLDSTKRPTVDADYVRRNYLQSFATLLCIGEGGLIHHFSQYESLKDQKLPYRTRPDDFPYTTPDKFEDFKNAQWQFCASNLEYGMNGRFKEEDILPIILKEKIGEGGSAIIYKIVVDENYNALQPRGHVIPNRRHQHRNTFVLKTYRSAEAEDNYKAERDAYMKLRWAGKPSPHIIAYYGGFIHGDSYNLILEYADQGTLETFMRNTESPSTVEDTLLFWDRLFDITHGVMTIHGKIGNESSASQILKGWHQDVKPANILVFGGNGSSPYDCHFKIADLGLTHFIPSVSQPNDPSDLDAFGTRAYGLTYKTAFSDLIDECLGAPETFRSHVDTESSPLQVTQAVDIWSIGCVFSEGSVWAHHGWRRVVEYRRQRSVEIKAKGGDEGEHMFHVDGNLLDAVHNIHEDILGKSLTSGHITQSVLDRLVGEMLLRDESRPHAKWVFDKSKRLITEAEKKYGISVAGLAGNSSGMLINVKEAAIKTRSPPQVPHEHFRSRAEGELPLGEPLPPDDDDSSPSSSSSSSRSQSSPRRHHHKSASQGSKSRSIRAMESPPTGGQGSHVVPDLLTLPSTATNTQESSPPQHVQQRQEEPLRPTLSINEGHAWKKKKKAGEIAVLPGEENLTSLDQRDHVSHVPSRPKLANKWL